MKLLTNANISYYERVSVLSATSSRPAAYAETAKSNDYFIELFDFEGPTSFIRQRYPSPKVLSSRNTHFSVSDLLSDQLACLGAKKNNWSIKLIKSNKSKSSSKMKLYLEEQVNFNQIAMLFFKEESMAIEVSITVLTKRIERVFPAISHQVVTLTKITALSLAIPPKAITTQ